MDQTWRHHKRAPIIGAPKSLRPWLQDQGSLTQRLVTASDGQFAVRLLRQGWDRPRVSEARRLGTRPGEWAIIREVELICGGEPWVFARSVIPLKTLTGRLRSLRGLDNRPLGALLFSDPSMRRTLFEISKLSSASLGLSEPASAPAKVWGRRSLFYLDDKPLLVAEIFLNSMQDHPLELHYV